MRTVKIFSTKAGSQTSIRSAATTWAELRSQVLSETTALKEDMVASVFETRNSLISDAASLPEGDFTLVLTPAKTKSGTIDTAAVMASLRDKINEAFDEIIEEIENGDHGSADGDDIPQELKNFKL